MRGKGKTMREIEKMTSGELYLPGDVSIMEEQSKHMEKLYEYNHTRPCEAEKRAQMLAEMFLEIGEDCYIEPPFYANWGGAHVRFGKSVYANFHLTLVDDSYITVGDYTMFGPNVTISTAGHPIDPGLRMRAMQYNMPVTIGRNCWLGAGVIVMPGVTIGDNSVIGAGSVVTRDIPSNVVAVGVPCRVLREIGEHDKQFYWRDKEIDPSLFAQI